MVLALQSLILDHLFSEVGARRDEVDRRGSVVMDPQEFSDVLRNVIMSVKKCDDSKDVIVDDKGNVVTK